MTNEARIRANRIARKLDNINAKLDSIEKDIAPTEVHVSSDTRGIVSYEDADLAVMVKTLIKLALLRDKEALEKEMEAL